MQKRSCPATLSANGLVLLLALVVFRLWAFAPRAAPDPDGRRNSRSSIWRERLPDGDDPRPDAQGGNSGTARTLERGPGKDLSGPGGELIRNFLKKTDFQPAIDRWTPGLLDEVRGIADGAGVDFDTMYAYQLIDEIWVMGADLGLSKCTSIAAGKRNGNPAYIAQTLDIPVFYHGFPTILRLRDKRKNLETLVFTIPGLVAANGLNSRSVAVCGNAVTQLAYSPKGLPVAFVVRGILRQKSYKQAVKFLQDIPPAAPQNYVIGGPAEAASFERSARKMSAVSSVRGRRIHLPYEPSPDQRRFQPEISARR